MAAYHGFFLLLASVSLQGAVAARAALHSEEADPDSNSTSNPDQIVELAREALEPEAPSNSSSNVTNMTLVLEAGKPPGVDLWDAGTEGVWALPRMYGKVWEEMKTKTEYPSSVRIQKIDTLDVNSATYAEALHKWADLVNGPREYEVVIDWHQVPAFQEGGLPLTMTLCPLLIVGILPALFAGLFACCLLPCFLCRQCGICGCASILTAVPDSPKEEGQGESNSAAPRLDRSWFVRLTDSRLLQATFLVLSGAAAAIVIDIGFNRRGDLFAGRPLFSAAFLAFTCSWLFQSIVVMWGIEAVKHVALVAEGTDCYVDPNALASELRGLAFAFAPKLLPTIMFGIGLVCCLPLAVVVFVHVTVTHFERVKYYGYYNFIVVELALRVGMPGAIVACECVLTAMTCRFMLEAFLVASTAKALVKAVHDDLSKQTMDSVSPDHLKKVHIACVHVVNHVLPELAKISKPTLGLMALKAIWACSSVVPVVFILAHHNDNGDAYFFKMFMILVVCYILSDLILGLLCLLLPASVSDACADLVKEMNDLRGRPFKTDCEAEVERQIRLTELFLKEHNRGQGLGFVLDGFGTVVDKRMIISVFTKFLALSSIMLTVLRKAYEEPRRQLQEERLLRGG